MFNIDPNKKKIHVQCRQSCNNWIPRSFNMPATGASRSGPIGNVTCVGFGCVRLIAMTLVADRCMGPRSERHGVVSVMTFLSLGDSFI